MKQYSLFDLFNSSEEKKADKRGTSEKNPLSVSEIFIELIESGFING